MMRACVILAIGLALAGGMVVVPSAMAQPIRYVDDNAAPSGDGLSWGTAYTDLQVALLDAIFSGGTVTEIRVAAGTYRPDAATGDKTLSFHLLTGVRIYGGFPNGGGALADRDPSVHVSELSGDLAGDDLPGFVNYFDNSYNVVVADAGVDPTAVLDGFVISGGNAWGGDLPKHRGGGMHIGPNDNPKIVNCTFNANSGFFGGAVFIGGTSDSTFNACAFSDNYANHGGGVCIDLAAATLNYCGFFGNETPHGGGAMLATKSDVELVNCLFAGNSATGTLSCGGGVHLDGNVASLINCVFSGNFAANQGGAVYNNSALTVANCTFSANASEAPAGGLYTRQGGTITNSVFWDNEYLNGTAEVAQIYNASSSTLTVSHCCVQNWTGEGSGNISSNPRFKQYPSPGSDGKWDGVNDDYGNLRLRSDSPCIDAGKDSAVLRVIDYDFRSRIAGCRVDMGAYEATPPDGDGDGVADACDDCPSTPVGDSVDSSGCSTADDDGDGVLNDEDDCADTPSCATNIDASGCAIDTDGDGNVDGCEPPAQGCCGATGPVAPLGLAVGMLLLGRFRRHVTRGKRG